MNPSINAVTVVLGEQALEAAKAADRVVAGGAELPPFHGVPFTVKENIDLVGTPTTMGLKALAGAYPRLDAPVVERMRAAGRSRSAAPTALTSPFAGTPTANYGGRRSTRGTGREPPGRPAAARRRRSPPG